MSEIDSWFQPLECRRLLDGSGAGPNPPGTTGGGVNVTLMRPAVLVCRPADRASAIDVNTFISADVWLPNSGHGVDPSTLKSDTVILRRASDGAVIPATVNTSAAGDSIVLTPAASLSPLTRYRVIITENVRDTAGAGFHEHTTEFTTGVAATQTSLSTVRFKQFAQPGTNGHAYTGVAFGPDGNLYAATRQGFIIRFTLDESGNIVNSKTIRTVRNQFNGNRVITGIAFAPSASPRKPPVVYFTHGDGRLHGAPDWTGRISRLSGRHLNNYADLVTGLPRSSGDHLTNQLTFGQDNNIYVAQGSNTAMGAPDATWDMRPERLLTAAILQVDLSRIGEQPLNVRTEGVSSPYNPFAENAPLRIYASGLRNAYDMVWTRDGKLFATNNGSAAGGNTPSAAQPFSGGQRIDAVSRGRYLGPTVPALWGVATQDDTLIRVQSGKYYGHPNPTRSEYVMNGGNPSTAVDAYEVAEYPVGTKADRNFVAPHFNFGRSNSANGIIEYTGANFGNAINGALMTVRYSGGDDVMILTRNSSGNVTGKVTHLPGLRGFVDPVDLVQHPTSGALYVAEYGGRRITLVRPDEPGIPAAGASPAPLPPPTPSGGSPFAASPPLRDLI